MRIPINAPDPSVQKSDISHFYAKESEDPLTHAFSERIVVHPGGKTPPLPRDLMEPTYADLITAPRPGKTAAYIHVPFCESHCLYCGFFRKRYDPGQSRRYADALVTELRAFANTTAKDTPPVHAVYLGGGTPTSLEAMDLKQILGAIEEYLPLANDCEITVEGRIHNFGPEKMEACLAGGANRFSIGVQSFDTELRQSMKRLASREEVIDALTRLRAYDQAAVVIDLIYGFPGQTMAMWKDDIQTFIGLELDGVDLYQLNIFKGTPLHTAIDKGKLPPGTDRPGRALMYAKGVAMMDKAMYRRLTVNHWGRTSRERNIYNQMMKSPSDCLAFGPGAGGSLDGHFFFLEADYEKWRTAVMDQGRKPISMMASPSAHGRLEKTITAEMELCRINPGAIGKNFKLSLSKILSPLFDQWTRAGLMERQGDWFILTTAGQFWQVNLSQLTLNYLFHSGLKEG